jgi:ornithine cyclodeaminase/alanine dehydrogenase-like protein (mu-crystallin family)
VTAALPRLPYIAAEEVFAALPWADAAAALESALLDGLDPETALDRSMVPVGSGQLLLMPAETGSAVGVKLAAVAPDNPRRSLPRIQALYVLLDKETLTPVAVIDGTALTTVRTPALSAVAVRHLAPAGATHLVVFGSGPQAWGHVEALRVVRPLDSVTVVARDLAGAEALAARVRGSGLEASVGGPDSVADADVVVCATTASSPLFDAASLRPEACVVAVGSHEPDRRELGSAVLRCAAKGGGVVVEALGVALREAGDVVLAVRDGAISPDQLESIASVVRREHRRPGISVYKSVGMGWQDLVVAKAVFDRLGFGGAP